MDKSNAQSRSASQCPCCVYLDESSKCFFFFTKILHILLFREICFENVMRLPLQQILAADTGRLFPEQRGWDW